eukprot:168457-Chlamydomonas_euryale.AAC.1
MVIQLLKVFLGARHQLRQRVAPGHHKAERVRHGAVGDLREVARRDVRQLLWLLVRLRVRVHRRPQHDADRQLDAATCPSFRDNG